MDLVQLGLLASVRGVAEFLLLLIEQLSLVLVLQVGVGGVVGQAAVALQLVGVFFTAASWICK